MRSIGDVVPGVVGSGAVAGVAPDGQTVAPLLRGVDVVLPANPPALPTLPVPLGRRVAVEGDVPPPVVERLIEEGPRAGERVVVEPAARVALSPVPAGWKRDAEEPIARLRRILAARPHPRTVEAWLQRLAAGVAITPEGQPWRDKVLAVTLAVQSCPHLCFTAASLELGLQRWKWWPSAAEVFALCEEVAKPYRDMLRGLEAIERAPVGTGPARERLPEAVAEKSPEEIAAVRAAAAAFTAEVRAREAAERAARPLTVMARPLAPHQLIAHLEADIRAAGGPGAKPHLDARLALERARFPGASDEEASR